VRRKCGPLQETEENTTSGQQTRIETFHDMRVTASA